MKVFKAVFELL